MGTKVISTIIEDEVTFMTDANVEFVSLVKHGANRTPFKILKHDKGGVDMDKVITAVLIPTEVSEEDTATQLEGFRSDEVKEYDSYKSYIQVAEGTVDLDTVEVVVLDKDLGILGVTADLKDTSDKGDENTDGDNDIEPKVVEKEALDYADMDSLYNELYAMADIVGGSMRQSNIEPKARQKTILSAIDNFRSFAEILLKNLKKEDIRSVKAEDHPELAHTFVPVAEEDEPTPVFDADAFEGLILGKVDEKFEELLGSLDFEAKMEEILDKIKDAVKMASEDVKAVGVRIDETAKDKTKDDEAFAKTVKSLTKDVDQLKTTPKGDKTEKDEEEEGDPTDKSADFTGTLFSWKTPSAVQNQ